MICFLLAARQKGTDKMEYTGLTYDPLIIQLAKKRIPKERLIDQAGLPRGTVAKIKNNKSMTLDSIARICRYLNCQIQDVVQYVPEPDEKPQQANIEYPTREE